MKFYSHELNNGLHGITIEVSDNEYHDVVSSSGLLKRFEMLILNRLAMMVAGYYFKKHKDEIVNAINIEDVNKSINEEIKRRLIDKLLEKR